MTRPLLKHAGNPRLLALAPVVALLLRFTEAGGDPGIFCYRMGVDIFSSGGSRLLLPAPIVVRFVKRTATRTRNQVSCSNLFSTLSARSSTRKD